MEEVAAGLALGPERLAAARPEGHAAFGGAFLERLFVHVAQHQHLEGAVVLDDDREETVAGLI